MSVERHRRQGIGRTAAKVFAAVVLASAATACSRWPGLYYGSLAHLKDNPFDRAIDEGGLHLAKNARERTLKRFPIGSQVEDLRRYLESIGSTCKGAHSRPLVCQYSQFSFVALRGYIGDEWRGYAYRDFTTRIWPDRGTIAKVTICYSVTNERQNGPTITGGHSYVRKSEFKPCV